MKTKPKSRYFKIIYRSFFNARQLLVRLRDKYGRSPKATVLAYHRIADLDYDPFFLAVSRNNFEKQIQILKSHFEIVSIPELICRLQDKKLRGNELAITLDDGYRDNLLNALPIAEKYEVPLTIFISARAVANKNPFAWDELYENDQNSYLSNEEVKLLAHHPLVTIGSHTLNHERLSDLPERDQANEVRGGKNFLEAITGKEIRYFAYPFGGPTDFGSQTKKLAKESGHIATFTAIPGAISPRVDLRAIPRITVRNWGGEKLISRIKDFILLK